MSEALALLEPAFSEARRFFSDERLVRRAVTGDRRAFAAIFRRYHRELYRFALAIVGDGEDAADALQATMVKAMRALPGERREIQLKPWLYRVVHNESVELLRRRQDAQPLSPEIPAATPQPHEEAEQRSRLRTLLHDLDELSERQRGALLMRELSGLAFEEIAAALQASPAVVRQAIYEARLSLRQMEAGRSLECDSVTRALSENDGRVSRRRDLRAHLRSCPGCRHFQQGIVDRKAGFAAIAPFPVLIAAGVLKAAVGAEGSSGLCGSMTGGMAGGFGASVAAKSVATVAVTAILGASAADRSGLVDLGFSGGGGHDRVVESGPAAGNLPSPGSTGGGRSASAVPASGAPTPVRSGQGRVRSGPSQSGALSEQPPPGHNAHPGVSTSSGKVPAATQSVPAPAEHGGGPPPAAEFGQQTSAEGSGGGQVPTEIGGRPESPPDIPEPQRPPPAPSVVPPPAPQAGGAPGGSGQPPGGNPPGPPPKSLPNPSEAPPPPILGQ